MSQNPQSQTGKTLIIAIIISIVAALSFLGVLLWDNLHADSNSKTDTSATQTATTTEPVKPELLTLSDWSIGFTLPAGLKLSEVYFYKAHVGEGPDYYGFTTNRVRAQGGACDNQVTGNLISLSRMTNKNGSDALLNNEAIGGYYYYESSSVDEVQPIPACLQTTIASQDHTLLNSMAVTLTAK